MAAAKAKAHLTFYKDEHYKSGCRFLAIEWDGTFARHHKLTTPKPCVPLREALGLYLVEEGLTQVGRIKRVGTTLRVGVR